MNKDAHRQEVQELGFEPKPLAKLIRKWCYGCQGYNWCAVNKCDNKACEFYPYRFGFNPFNKKSNNSHISEIGKMALSGEQINIKYPYKLNGHLNHNQLKDESNPMISLNLKVAPEASACVKTKKLTKIKERLLYFVYDKLLDNKITFYQSEIENLHMPERHTAETKARKYRELNNELDLSECISRRESKHRIKKSLLEVHKILRSCGL